MNWLLVPLSSKLGFALDAKDRLPMNDLRHPPQGETNGWYLWGGEEFPSRDDSFQPLHTKHLIEYRPEVLKFLGLPPGYRFLIAADCVDVWFDPTPLDVQLRGNVIKLVTERAVKPLTRITMPSIDVEEQIQPGNEVIVSSNSPTAKYGVVFEDDRTAGYLYAIEFSGENYDIVGAMQIYNVSSVIDRDEPSTIQITWSEDGLKALLLINDYPHAVFDFANHKGFCRTNLPSPAPNWKGHEWSDQALESF